MHSTFASLRKRSGGYSSIAGWLLAAAAVFAAGVSSPTPGHALPNRPPSVSSFADLPVLFVENSGQTADPARFYALGKRDRLYFSDSQVTISMSGDAPDRVKDRAPAWTLKLSFPGSHPDVSPDGAEKDQAVISYFSGPGSSWKSGLKTFRSVLYHELWDGIDLAYSGASGKMKQEFRVRPGADPARVRQRYEGADRLEVLPNGDLAIRTPVGTLTDARPYAFQWIEGRRMAVECAFEVNGAEVGFKVGAYDSSRELVIDPAFFIYSGFIGGSANDSCTDIVCDRFGNGYVVGETESSQATFPVTSGPDLTQNGQEDAFVAKIATDGRSLAWCCYLGGSGRETATAIDLDVNNSDVFVVGSTDSENFPVTANAYQGLYQGGTDSFVTRINPGGTALTFSTYFGGSALDAAQGMDEVSFSTDTIIYVAGKTASTNLPTGVVGSTDTTYNGGASDAFATTILVRPASTTLYQSGYIGGSGDDEATGIAVQPFGTLDFWVFGVTNSTQGTFPVTTGTLDTTHSGVEDCFVTKVSSEGAIQASTYFGGSGEEMSGRIKFFNNSDRSVQAIFLCGGTASTEGFPVTAGSFDTTFAGGIDGFVARLNLDLTANTFTTFIGGSQDDFVADVSIDESTSAYVVGTTASSENQGFPVSNGPDGTFGGDNDAFATRFNTAGSGVLYSGFIGGPGLDEGLGTAEEGSSTQFICGSARTVPKAGVGGFILQNGPSISHGGGIDGFVTRIQDSGPTAVALASFQSTPAAGGAVIHWRTSGETSHAGFRLWRGTPGSRELVSERMLPGTAFLSSTEHGVAGRSYALLDREPGGSYLLEAMDLAGNSQWLGPLSPQTSGPGLSPSDLQAAEDAAAAEERRDLPAEGSLRRWAPSVTEPEAGIAAGANSRPGWAPTDLASLPAAQIEITQEGWYRVTGADLAAAGLSRPASRQLRLFAGRHEVAVRVSDGGDRRLDAADTLEFYGVGLDTPWTDRRTYWLTASAGLRSPAYTMGDGTVGPERPGEASFPDAVERQDRTIYFAALQNGDAPNLFGAILAPGNTLGQTLVLPDPDRGAGGGALVEIDLQGVTDPVGENDHQVHVSLNGTELGTVTFDGKEEGLAAFPAPSSLLRDGVNEVQLRATGGPADISLVDTLRIQYRRLYRAVGNQLRFRASSGRGYSVDGFSTGAITVADVTDIERPVLLGTRSAPSGKGFRISGVTSGRRNQTRLLLAFGEDQILTPAGIHSNSPSSLRARGNEADFLIIGPGNLLAAAEPLAAARRKAGLLVRSIDIQDVYDEQTAGEKSPYALRDFLTRTVTSWRRKPGYALLLGDASIDPRGQLGLGLSDLIPTLPIPTETLEAPGDDRLGDRDGDGVADVALGRLPARTEAEATLMIGKCLAREDALRAGGEWTRTAYLFADGRDTFDFAGQAAQINTPLSGKIERRGVLWTTQQPAGLAATALEQGGLTATYFGHGSVGSWAGSFLTSGQARGLRNGNRLPILLGLTCLNGLFTDPFEESLGEALLRAPKGGAAGLWLSGALTQPGPQAVMGQVFFRELATGKRLGDAVRTAKQAVVDGDVRRSWVLLGDPTMKLQ